MQHSSGPHGTKLLSRLFPRRRRLAGALSVTEFERAFNTELARSERSEKAFSMLVFSAVRTDQDELPELARILKSRLRTYDVFGLFDARRIGVLLPYTDGEHALELADHITERLVELELDFDCEVFTSPADLESESEAPSHDRDDDDDDGDAPNSGGGGGGGSRRGRIVPWPKPLGAHDGKKLANLRIASAKREIRDIWEHVVQPMPIGKRALDVAVSSACLVACLPVFAAVAVAIKTTSPGPVIFRQQRAGIGGRPFTFYKFRSMFVDAEARKAALLAHNEVSGPAFKMKNDPRMTSIGRWIRKFSIDELPQLWNVLKGDMTLVGPRPPTLNEVPAYARWQRRRLAITGGITCIWQVSGRSTIGFEDWMRMDVRYSKSRTPWVDLSLLARTAGAVISGRGAY